MNFKKRLFKKHAIYFAIGGVGYGIIELVWRGRTHWTMILAGGICFIIFSLIEEKLENQSTILKSILSAVAITTIELIFGIIFNIFLNMNVWDYSNIPHNLLGQICPIYSLLWVALSLAAAPLMHLLNGLFDKETKLTHKNGVV